MPEFLRGHPQGAIEFTRSIFPGNDLCEFDDGIVVVELLYALKQIIADILIAQGNRVGISQRDTLGCSVMRTGFIVWQVVNLFIRDP